jgi:ankyrin repeat protein
MRLTMGEAAAVGDAVRVRKLAGRWPEAIHEYTSDGFTPLQLACFFGHYDIAAFLVAEGADIHAVAKNAMSIQPLHAAVAGQSAEIVKLLIEHGADANARQQSGFTPLMAARQNNSKEIESLLLDAGAS